MKKMQSPQQVSEVEPETMARALAWAKTDLELCARDPWHAIRKGWVLTEDEKPPPGVPVVRPLPDLQYLEAIARLWGAAPIGLLAKSRQLLVSWLFAWLNLWDAIFHAGRHSLFQGKRLDDVSAIGTKGILGRARFIRTHLPPFLQPEIVGETTTYESYKNGSTLEAIPEGEHVIRGKVISSLFMDEVSFQQTAERNWNAAVPAAQNGGRLWAVSTPNGHEFLYRQADPGRAWDAWRRWPEILPGLHSYRNQRGVQLVALHYTGNPAFRDAAYQTEIRDGYTNARAYARERELDFTLVEGLGVYANEFDQAKHVVEKYAPDPQSPLYRGWDISYNGQAVSFFQTNHAGQVVWFDQVIYKAVPLQRVVQEVKLRTLRHLGRPVMEIGLDEQHRKVEAQILDYGEEPARAHHSTGETDAAVLASHGVHLIMVPVSGRKVDLVENLRRLLLPRSDGTPGLLVARCSNEIDHVVAGFAGGYHYAEPKEGKAEKELPEKDGFYDHIFDSAQHAIDRITPARRAVVEEEPGNWWVDREPGIGTEDYGKD